MKKQLIFISVSLLFACPGSYGQVLLGKTEQVVRNDQMNKNLPLDVDYSDPTNGKMLEFHDDGLKITKCYFINLQGICSAMMYIFDTDESYAGMVRSLDDGYISTGHDHWKSKKDDTMVETGYSPTVKRNYIKFTWGK